MADIAVKKSRKKVVVAVVIIAVVVVAGLYGFFQLRNMAVPVSFAAPDTIVLKKTNLENKVTASGNFASRGPVTVGSNAQGAEVETVYVAVGSKVYEGDVLAQLKTTDIERSIEDTKAAISDTLKAEAQKLEAAQRAFNDADTAYYAELAQQDKSVEKAQASLTAAEQALADADPEADPKGYAIKQDAVSKAQDALDMAVTTRENTMRAANSRWYEAKAQVDALSGNDSTRQQRSQLESLKESLANASVTTPITGIVTQVNTEAGKAVMGTMFVVEDTEQLEITASVAEYDVIKIEKGMAAHIKSNATGDEAYDGAVDFVAPVALDKSGNFEVKILVTGSAGSLKPGMTATIEIVTSAKRDIFALPIDAVETRPDGTKVVYVYEPESVPEEGAADGGPDGAGLSSGGEPGGGPDSLRGSDAGPGSGGNSGRPDGAGGRRPMSFGLGGGPRIGNAPASGVIDRTGWREIVVKTGMETDYYIEIISGELVEGMLIVADPMGRSVRSSGGPMFGAMGGGETVRYESASPVMGGSTVTVVQ